MARGDCLQRRRRSWGNHLQCHGWSGGTKYSAMDDPGGPLLGGTTYSMTEESQKIDDLPVLATCRSGTSAMLSSKFNRPIAHGSTR